MKTRKEIVDFMRREAREHIDPKTGEVNCTSLVEAWDASEGTGSETIDDPHHPAWEIAVTVAEEIEESKEGGES